ncbi:MAG: twin-arginine translocase subunit TatC [Phycisphaerales bacterium]
MPDTPAIRQRHGHDSVLAMPLGDHIEDLRRRLIIALLGLVPILLVSLVFGRQIIDIMLVPLRGALQARGLPPVVQVTGPMETFGAYLRVSIAVAVVVGLPWLLYQAWKFAAPGLYAAERRFVYVLAPMSVGLTLASVAFLYFVMMPIVLAFFIGFGQALGGPSPGTADTPPAMVFPEIPSLRGDPPNPEPGQMWINTRLQELRIAVAPAETAVPEASESDPQSTPPPTFRVLGAPLALTAGLSQQFRVSEYIKLLFQLTLAMAVAFQTPVAVLLLCWTGLIDPRRMGKHRKYAVVVAVLLGAFLTPADPISMIALAVPLFTLYELGLLLARVLPAERLVGKAGEGDVDDEAV